MHPALCSDYAALSQEDLTVLREHALSWLSHDKGLLNVLYPVHNDTPSLTADQRCAHAKALVQSLLGNKTESGRAATHRTFTREAAASLRRMTDRLRDNSFTHRDIATMTVLLESLWDDANTDLSDHMWARCSMRFDTALITLRVTYILTYLRTECPPDSHPVPVRKTVYNDLINTYLSSNAPTDHPQDKHSHNFKALLDGWHNELAAYINGDDFDAKLERLRNIQQPHNTAQYVLRFIKELGVDHSWLLDAAKLESDVKSGALVPAATAGAKPKPPGRKPKKKGAATSAPTTTPVAEPDNPSEPESSPFEPAAADSDYNVDVDAQENEEEEDGDDGDDSNAQIDSPGTRRFRRNHQTRDGDMVRRSLRVARAGVRRKHGTARRTRKNPERFSELHYPAGQSRTPDRKLASRKTRIQMVKSMSELVDDEPGWEGGTYNAGIEGEEEEEEVVDGSSPAQRTRGRKGRVILNEDEDVPLRESGVSNEVMLLSQKLDPDSQTFESTGLSDVDEVTANVVRQRRLARALEKVKLRVRAENGAEHGEQE